MNTTSYPTQGPLCDLRGEEKDKEGKKRATLFKERERVCAHPYGRVGVKNGRGGEKEREEGKE